MYKLLDILQWAFPTGFSLVNLALVAALWIKNRAHIIADTRSTWQAIAESNNEALLKQNDQSRSLRQTLSKMEGILFRSVGCRYYSVCPVQHELPKYKAYIKCPLDRQPGIEHKGVRFARDHPDVDWPSGDPDGQPP